MKIQVERLARFYDSFTGSSTIPAKITTGTSERIHFGEVPYHSNRLATESRARICLRPLSSASVV